MASDCTSWHLGVVITGRLVEFLRFKVWWLIYLDFRLDGSFLASSRTKLDGKWIVCTGFKQTGGQLAVGGMEINTSGFNFIAENEECYHSKEQLFLLHISQKARKETFTAKYSIQKAI